MSDPSNVSRFEVTGHDDFVRIKFLDVESRGDEFTFTWEDTMALAVAILKVLGGRDDETATTEVPGGEH